MTPPAPSALRRFFALSPLGNQHPSLHGLRAVAIASVVQHHVTDTLQFLEKMPVDAAWAARSRSVFFGMDLFFVLSGFLIGLVLLRARDAKAPGAAARFYLRRAARTFPSYYVVIAALVALFGLTAAQRAHLPFELVYLTNFMPLMWTDVVMSWGWSLALEEQFYLSAPLLVWGAAKLAPRRALIALTALCVAALVVRAGVYASRAQWTDDALERAVYFSTFARFDTLVAGVLCALVHHRHGATLTAWLSVPRNRGVIAVTGLSCLWSLLQPDALLPLPAFHVLAWGTITSLMYACVLALLLHGGEGLLRSALSLPAFRGVATLGYGVYLVHVPVCHTLVARLARALHARGTPMGVVWCASLAAALVASFAAAYVLHLCVEKPALRLRDRFGF
jgi:hypothetical protein